jgi:hypothetical protein
MAVKVDMYSLSGRQIKTLSVSDIRKSGAKLGGLQHGDQGPPPGQ